MPSLQEISQPASSRIPAEPSDEPPQPWGIRLARVSDLVQLNALEKQSFTSDRFSPRTLRALATGASSEMWAAVSAKKIIGYVATLYRSNSALARVYGLCVTPAARGRGVARALLAKAERGAHVRQCRAMRLEVRSDNHGALALYGAAHYTPMRDLPGYYADGCDGIRLQKKLSSLTRQGHKP